MEYKVGDVIQSIGIDGESLIIFSLDSIYKKNSDGDICYRVTVLHSTLELDSKKLYADTDFLKESHISLAPPKWQLLYGK